ncbi:septation protein SpoVG family protein [bacterium]|nr:septation protein SpoVG family protein [bacterium]
MLEDFEIRKITFYNDGYALANVNFRLGPIVIRGAKVFSKGKKRWLSMPGRMDDSGQWNDLVYFPDDNIRKKIEIAVLQEIDKLNKISQGEDKND